MKKILSMINNVLGFISFILALAIMIIYGCGADTLELPDFAHGFISGFVILILSIILFKTGGDEE